jgi:hypothetical protein
LTGTPFFSPLFVFQFPFISNPVCFDFLFRVWLDVCVACYKLSISWADLWRTGGGKFCGVCKEFPQAGRLRGGRASKQSRHCKLQSCLPLPRLPFSQARPRSSDSSCLQMPYRQWVFRYQRCFPPVRISCTNTLQCMERGRKWDTERQQNSPSQPIIRHYRQTLLFLLLCRLYTVYRTAAHCTDGLNKYKKRKRRRSYNHNMFVMERDPTESATDARKQPDALFAPRLP